MKMPRLTADNRQWWILATMTRSLSMILLDETAVGRGAAHDPTQPFT
jgi:hypothetical protein